MEVKETAKIPEWIFGHLICQLSEEISDSEINDLGKIEMKQILAKEKLAKSMEMQNVPSTNSFNATPRYGVAPPNKPYPSPSQPYPSSIQFPTFS